MKAIFVLPSLRVNGTPIIFELADRLADSGHDVRITTLDELQSSPYPLRIIPQKLPDSLEFFEKADVIIGYYPVAAFYINELDVQAKKFYFLTDDVRAFYSKEVIKANAPNLDDDRLKIEFEAQQAYLEASYNLPMTFLATNNDLAEMLKSQYKRRVHIIPIGLNSNIFYPDTGIPKGDIPRILVEGNMLPWKGINEINRALSDLRGFQLWTISNTNFTIKSDKHWQNPSIEDLRKILSSCDILIKAYWEDGLAELQAQAMACGCAVITRETAGSKMFCKHEVNCLMFKAEDKEKSAVEIKKSLERLIKDKELREKLVRNGLEAVKQLDWNKSCKILEEALKGGRKHAKSSSTTSR